MGPHSGPLVLLCILAVTKALAANVDLSSNNSPPSEQPRHMVAFTCDVKDQPMMYKTAQGWQINPQDKSGCLDKPEDILKLCKEAYPDEDVRYIVPVENVEITAWPDKSERVHSRKASAYQCLIGVFQSAALLVPEGCQFKHLNSPCASYEWWKKGAVNRCRQDGMTMRELSMLMPCAIGQFDGVEFVCCKPKNQTHVDVAAHVPQPKGDDSQSIEVKEKQPMDAYTAYLQNDKEFLKQFSNEHKKFLAAEAAMDRQHKARIAKMMAEWEESRNHIKEMKKTDPKGAATLSSSVMKRFQLMLTGYEQADIAEKKQLIAVHLQHVQAKFNKQKRKFLEKYMTDLQKRPANLRKIYKDLRDYIKVEERDRQHTLNHFTHVRDHDIAEAKRIQSSSLDHLTVLDERINQALDMLHHFKDIEHNVRPKIDSFRHQYDGIAKTARQILTRPIILEEETKPEPPKTDINIDWGTQAKHTDTDSNESSQSSQSSASNTEDHNGTEMKIGEAQITNDVRENDGLFDSENLEDGTFDPETHEDEHNDFVAHHAQSKQGFQESKVIGGFRRKTTATGSVLGIAIGSVAVFVIIVVAVIMLRKHSHRRPVTHGFVEVDPAASPEERHVANMQMNGYENPTYQYFELNNPQKA